MWCALVFSSNCFMARSARKIFQNKAIDGNYISTLGTDGMWTLSALCKKHPSIRQTHVIVACWGWARVWRRGAEVPIQDRWDPRRPLFRLEALSGACHSIGWASRVPWNLLYMFSTLRATLFPIRRNRFAPSSSWLEARALEVSASYWHLL